MSSSKYISSKKGEHLCMIKTMEEVIKKYDSRLYDVRYNAELISRLDEGLKEYTIEIEYARENKKNEEYFKNIINGFLKKYFFYDKKYIINTDNNIDSAIISDEKLLVIIETKNPINKTEMIQINNLNKKAMWEVLFYYMDATRDVTGSSVRQNYNNNEVRRIIVTDSFNWFFFDVNEIEKICSGYLEKEFFKYQRGQLTYKNEIHKFYEQINKYLASRDLEKELNYVYFDINDVKGSSQKRKELYKLLTPCFLLKEPYQPGVKTHVLKKKFYQELLYILGLREEKINNKMRILLDETIKNSFAEQIYHRYNDDKDLYGEKAYEKTLELIIIWINRILFVKLFEGQLLKFNSRRDDFQILNIDKITSFKDLQNLFFNVLGKRIRDTTEFYNQFKKIPYLNSSLFERQKIEYDDYNIGILNNDNIVIYPKTVLTKEYPQKAPLLRYLFDFLNAYEFGTNLNEVKSNKKDIIDAAVLGLLFEKINGYKDGSYYTKSSVTEYMAKYAIEQLVIDRVNTIKKWKCKSLSDIKFQLSVNRDLEEYKEINNIIDGLRICDPAVGSGHFLVSVLNRIITVKAELGVLFYSNSKELLNDKDIYVQGDVLCIEDAFGQNFQYDKTSVKAQRVQETLFNEKRKIIENCLFGVDINSKAVHICQLRLWIELLKSAYYNKEGEMETLPNIDIKIQTGNSLLSKIKFDINSVIGKRNVDLDSDLKMVLKEYRKSVEEYKKESNKDKKRTVSEKIDLLKQNLYMSYQQMCLFEGKSNSKLEYISYNNALEWALVFPEIISEEGKFEGFDCIIGNPPYGVDMSETEKEKYRQTYKDVHMRIQDTYLYFISLANRLVKKNGIVSYIVPNNFFYQTECQKARELMFEHNCVLRAINLGDGVFSTATVPTCIFWAKTVKRQKYRFQYSDFRKDDIDVVNWNVIDEYIPLSYLQQLPSKVVGVSVSEQKIVDSIKERSVLVNTIFDVISQGITTGGNEAYIYDINLIKQNSLEKEYLRPVLKGENIHQYYYKWDEKYIAYIDKTTEISKCPNIEKILFKSYEKLAAKREVKNGNQEWYSLHWPRKREYFENEKIIMKQTGDKIVCAVDREGYYSINSTLVLNKADKSDEWNIDLCVALLNSSISQYQYNLLSKEEKRGFAEVKPTNVKKIYLPKVSLKAEAKIMESMKEIYEFIEEKQYEKVEDKKRKIDRIIYEECGFGEKEIEMIEKNVGYL